MSQISLIPMQKGMIFYSMYSGNESLYLIQIIIHLHESIDLKRMQIAWQTILDDNEILKTYFKFVKKECTSKKDKKLALPFQFIDFSSDPHPEESFSNFSQKDLNTGIDVTQAPLFRIFLIKISAKSYKLIWTIHHSIIDASSVCFLVKELFQQYDKFPWNKKESVERTLSYDSFIDQFNNEPFEKHKSFWNKIVTDVSPIDLGNKTGLYTGVKKIKFKIPEHIHKSLTMIVKNEHVPFNSIFQCMWGLLLARYSKKQDILFGSVWALKQAHISKTPGLFINTLPTRTTFHNEESILNVIKELRIQHKEIRKHLYSSLPNIRTLSSIKPQQELFLTVIDYKSLSANDLVKSIYPNWGNRYLDFQANNHQALLLEIFHENNRLYGALNYQTSLFNEKDASNIIEDYLALLEQFSTRKDIRFNEIELNHTVIQFCSPDFEPKIPKKSMKPSSITEKKIAEIWKELFKIEDIDVESNFFEIGGYSLLAMAFVTEMEKKLRIRLTLSDLIYIQTISELAKFVDSKQKNQLKKLDEQINFQINKDDVYKPFAMTPIQKAYFLGRSQGFSLNIEPIMYFEWEVKELELHQLEISFNKLIDRHPMLRVIMLNDAEQQILPTVPPYIITFDDFSTMESKHCEEEFLTKRSKMLNTMFTIEKWPLFKISVSKKDNYYIHMLFSLITVDAGSMQILLNELNILYENTETKLPSIQPNYRDYALAINQIYTLSEYKEDKKYWHEKSSVIPLGPALPIVKFPKEITNTKFKQLLTRIESNLWSKLLTKSKFSGITGPTLLVTVLSLILRKWAVHQELTINFTLFNRLPFHPDINNIIGDFTSLEMLGFTQKQESFINYAKTVQADLWNDLSHSYYSGIELQQYLTKLHNLNAENIFPVVFTSLLDVLQPNSIKTKNLFTDLNYSMGKTPQVWIDNRVYEKNGHLYIAWDYVPDLFPPGMVEDMFLTYQQTIESLVDLPWTHLLEVHIPNYQKESYAAGNQTNTELAIDTLPQLFLNQVTKYAHKSAVITDQVSFTYAELFDRVRAIVGLFETKNDLNSDENQNQLVAIIMEKGWEQIVGSLASMVAGYIYVPIDPEFPPERIAYMLKNAHVKYVLTQLHLKSIFSKDPDFEHYHYIFVDQADLYEKKSPIQLKNRSQIDNIAYVIYTSGSTGLPKGVMVTHRSAANTILDINQRFNVNSEDVVLALSNLNFDLSIYDIFGLLAVGGTIFLPCQEGLKDPAYWLDQIQKHRITIWNTAPMFMMMLCEYVSNQNNNALNSIRLIMLSGDKFPTSLSKKIFKYFNNSKLKVISLGGATEAAIWSIFTKVKKDWPLEKPIVYGKPLGNQSWYVLDKDLCLRPFWAEGDLYIAGLGLAEGYWLDQEKTVHSFIHHPELKIRLYKTGDLGRYLPDGNIEFLGRSDFQVKISGYRIELGEIEAQIQRHPITDFAVVTAVKKECGETDKLVAYIKIKDIYLLKEFIHPENLLSHIPIKKLTLTKQILEKSNKAPIQLHLEIDHLQIVEEFYRRKSFRHFLNKPVNRSDLIYSLQKKPSQSAQKVITFNLLSQCLLQLSSITQEDLIKSKRKYPSASGLYPVNVYVFIPSAIKSNTTQLEPGCYYFDPNNNELLFLANSVASINSEFPTVYFIENKSLIEPVYGPLSKSLSLVECGYMINLFDMQEVSIEMDELTETETNFFNKLLKKQYDPLSLCKISFNPQHQSEKSFVNMYCYIKSDSSEKNDLYLYKNNELSLINSQAHLDKYNFSLNNWEIFESCQCIIFYVNTSEKTDADLDLVQSGRLAGHLVSRGLAKSMGFCPVGLLNPHVPLHLEPIDHPTSILHCLFGGYVTSEQILDKSLSLTRSVPEFLSQEFKEYISQILPKHMVPHLYHFVDHFKLGATGKIDIKALPKVGGIEHKKEHVLPANTLETTLLSLWIKVLKIEPISVEDDFFALGGNSLQAVQLVSLIKRTMKTDFNLIQLIEHSTIRQQSQILHNLAKVNQAELFLISPDLTSRFSEFPLTDIQHAYLLGRESYFVLGNISTQGYYEWTKTDLDVPKLENVLNQLIKRHGALRTIFTSNYTQKVLESVPYYQIEVDNQSDLTKDQFNNTISMKRQIMMDQIFNAASFPLFDIKITQYGTEYIIHMVMDLLIVDVTSFYMLLNEWLIRYQQPLAQFRPLDLSFRDYVINLPKIKTLAQYKQAESYWLNRINDLPLGPTLPIKTPVAKILKPIIRRVSSKLSADVWLKISKKCRDTHITPTTLLLTIFAFVLQHQTQNPKFCLNLTTFDRPEIHPDISEILGDFTSSILFEIDRPITRTESLTHFLKIFQQRLINDLDNSVFNGTQVQRLLKKKHKLSDALNLMPIVFTSALHIPEIGNEFDNPFYLLNFSATRTSSVSLDYTAILEKGELIINWDYVQDLYPDHLIEDFHSFYSDLLHYLTDFDWNNPLPIIDKHLSEIIPTKQISLTEKEPLLHIEKEKIHYQAPRTFMEEIFMKTVQEVLQLDQAGVYDNYFEIGGDSLLAVRLVTKLMELFPIKITARDLYLSPILNQFFNKIEKRIYESLSTQAVAQQSTAQAPHVVPEVALTDKEKKSIRNIPDLMTPEFLDFWEDLEQLYFMAVQNAFHKLNIFRLAGEFYTLETLMEKTGVTERFKKWLIRALYSCVEKKYITQKGDIYTSLIPFQSSTLNPCIEALQKKQKYNPLYFSEKIDIPIYIAQNLAEIITDKVCIATLLFNETVIPRIYQIMFWHCNHIIKESIQIFIANLYKDSIKVLDVGAGFGTTTAAILPKFHEEKTEYHFTDISKFFLQLAKKNFSSFPFIKTGFLNMDEDPVKQGYQNGNFDLIIATNLVHNTKNVKKTLKLIFDLLNESGTVIMIEETIFHHAFNLGFGLQTGFDSFDDYSLRSVHPFLNLEQWIGLLKEAGFENQTHLNFPGTINEFLGLEVFIASKNKIKIDALLHKNFPKKLYESVYSLPKQITSHYDPIIHFNKGGKTSPLVLIHPGHAGAECYTELSQIIGKNHPILAVDSYNMRSKKEFITSIPEIAAKYLDFLKQEGIVEIPFLGGWSLGGLIAYEMAQQLCIAGNPVKCLYLIDTYLLNKQDKKIWLANDYFVNDAIISQYFISMSSEEQSFFKKVYEAEAIAVMKYEPKSYEFPTLFLKAEQPPFFQNLNPKAQDFFDKIHKNLIKNWQQLIINFNYQYVNGNHKSIMESTNLKTLVSIIKTSWL